MRTRVDGANRAVLTLVGLLLLTGGTLGLVRGLGGFGAGRATASTVPTQLRSFASDTPWFWWVVAVGCLVVALLGLRWLVAQLRTDGVSRLDLTTDERDGVTTVHAGAVTDAVEDEARGIRGVADASAHLRGERGHRLHLAVDLTDYADVALIRTQVEGTLVTRVRQAVDDPDLPVEIELRLGAARSAGRGLR